MKRGKLKDQVLVTTVMSNVGLNKAMKEHGGSTVKTGVGDRYVLEEMLAHDYKLGGEQSGHIIFGDLAKTGDGMMTAVKLLGCVVRQNQSLSELGASWSNIRRPFLMSVLPIKRAGKRIKP